MILGESEDLQWSRWTPGTSGHLRTKSHSCFVLTINHVFLIVLSGNRAKAIFSLSSSKVSAGWLPWTLWEALGSSWCINMEVFHFQERLKEFTFLKCSALGGDRILDWEWEREGWGQEKEGRRVGERERERGRGKRGRWGGKEWEGGGGERQRQGGGGKREKIDFQRVAPSGILNIEQLIFGAHRNIHPKGCGNCSVRLDKPSFYHTLFPTCGRVARLQKAALRVCTRTEKEQGLGPRRGLIMLLSPWVLSGMAAKAEPSVPTNRITSVPCRVSQGQGLSRQKHHKWQVVLGGDFQREPQLHWGELHFPIQSALLLSPLRDWNIKYISSDLEGKNYLVLNWWQNIHQFL